MPKQHNPGFRFIMRESTRGDRASMGEVMQRTGAVHVGNGFWDTIEDHGFIRVLMRESLHGHDRIIAATVLKSPQVG